VSCDSIEEVLAIESAAVEAIKDFKVEKEEIITSTWSLKKKRRRTSTHILTQS
jgi:hypothetical protein